MGVKQHVEVFSPVHNTLKSVFPQVLGYGQAIYSYADEWGWNLAMSDSVNSSSLSVDEVDKRISERIEGELRFLDGVSYQRIFSLPKNIRKTLSQETRILTSEKPPVHFSSLSSVVKQ